MFRIVIFWFVFLDSFYFSHIFIAHFRFSNVMYTKKRTTYACGIKTKTFISNRKVYYTQEINNTYINILLSMNLFQFCFFLYFHFMFVLIIWNPILRRPKKKCHGYFLFSGSWTGLQMKIIVQAQCVCVC